MNESVIIFFCLVLIVIGLIFLIQNFYIPQGNVSYKYSPTEFVEPSDYFIKCYEKNDCIKVKGSLCPPESGGTEVCVNKNFFQEYISDINKVTGYETEVVCPQVYLVTNKSCGCTEEKCSLM